MQITFNAYVESQIRDRIPLRTEPHERSLAHAAISGVVITAQNSLSL